MLKGSSYLAQRVAAASSVDGTHKLCSRLINRPHRPANPAQVPFPVGILPIAGSTGTLVVLSGQGALHESL